MTQLTADEFSELIKEVFSHNAILEYATEENTEKFRKLSLLLQKANAETNLTAINDTSEIIVKHIADSLLACDRFEKSKSVIDIGCGAGFPTLPLAIARPDLNITALDSTGKKIAFVKSTAKALELDNVNAVCARAEEYVAIANKRESFDYATARAVSRLNLLNELALPFVKLGGSFIALKAKDGDNELAEAQNGINLFGGKVESVKHTILSDGNDFEAQRIIIEIKKIGNTPAKFPRSYAKIAKKPM
ncbi:MAG: 16S rRNA (guanine(527)-N(7))-methyltransferase RsmG [Clostridia bacterium]|nr:16S rRNA (guanine(527)-N(7))-methyltransferase RsmG [Clostridia bacterium]